MRPKNAVDTRRLNKNVTMKKIGRIQNQTIRLVLYFSTLTTCWRFLKQSITKPIREIKPKIPQAETLTIIQASPHRLPPSPGCWASQYSWAASHQKHTIIDVTKSKIPIFVKIQDRFNFGNSVKSKISILVIHLLIYSSFLPVHIWWRGRCVYSLPLFLFNNIKSLTFSNHLRLG